MRSNWADTYRRMYPVAKKMGFHKFANLYHRNDHQPKAPVVDSDGTIDLSDMILAGKMPLDQISIEDQHQFNYYSSFICFTTMVLYENDPAEGKRYFFEHYVPFMQRFHPLLDPQSPEAIDDGWK